MLFGRYEYTVDAKGRTNIPPKLRGELGETFYITKWLDGCIIGYGEKEWNRIAEILKEKHKKEFIKAGKDEKTADRLAEKKAIEDARFVLPNACETQMVMTMNARSLMNFFKIRCCKRAQWEIQDIANQMLALVSAVAPNLFKNAGPSCLRGGCSEGKMTCGKAAEVREFYKELKNNG